MKDLDLCQFTNGKEQLVLHVQDTDKFILMVQLEANSLHCIPIRGKEICDPQAPDPSWMPLSLESFKALGIKRVQTGYKVK
jgi:hypothetical protein